MINLLMVEDVGFFRIKMKQFLKDKYGINKFKFYEAEDYETAVRIFKQTDIDLIFLDINLTKFNGGIASETGIDILKVIDSSSKELPYTIILSGNINDNNFRKALDYGVEKFIIKPFERDTFFKEIDDALTSLKDKGII